MSESLDLGEQLLLLVAYYEAGGRAATARAVVELDACDYDALLVLAVEEICHQMHQHGTRRVSQ